MEEEEKISFWQARKEAVSSLRKAFQLDEARVKTLGDKVSDDPTPSKNLKTWMQSHVFDIALWFITLLVVWEILKPKKDKRRSHHGVNKYGQPY